MKKGRKRNDKNESKALHSRTRAARGSSSLFFYGLFSIVVSIERNGWIPISMQKSNRNKSEFVLSLYLFRRGINRRIDYSREYSNVVA
jgi:Na+/H+ antiporter NhaD/arsenite permease-like protein